MFSIGVTMQHCSLLAPQGFAWGHVRHFHCSPQRDLHNWFHCCLKSTEVSLRSNVVFPTAFPHPLPLSLLFSTLGSLTSDTLCSLLRILHIKCISVRCLLSVVKTLPVGTVMCPVLVTLSCHPICIHLTLGISG